MDKQQFKGRTAAEAAIKACEALGVTRSELKYTLVSDSGEAMARLVVIEAEASAQPARALAPTPAPAPRRHHDDADDHELRLRRARPHAGQHGPTSQHS